MERLELENLTPSGPITFSLKGRPGKRMLKLSIPDGISGELILDEREIIKLKEISHDKGSRSYALIGGPDVEWN